MQDSLLQRSIKAVWHPCTQMRQHDTGELPLLSIAHGKGAWLYDTEGRRYLDGISSWWVNLFGHCNPRINAALRDQLERLEHVILAGATHEPVVALSERLSALAGNELGHCFYASDGASATEIALKMSAHYWRNSGRPEKNRFLCLAGGYHGETVGALGVTDIPIFRDAYAPLLRAAAVLPSPDARNADSPLAAARHAAAALEAHLAEHHDRDRRADRRAAGPVRHRHGHARPGIPAPGPRAVRPLPGSSDLRRDRRRLRPHRHFLRPRAGRHGHSWRPDFLCLSKGITGGYLPLSVVMTRDAIYQAFLDDSAARGFLHSHSYTGNPLACRAALATLDIFAQDDVLAANARQVGADRRAAPAAGRASASAPLPATRHDLRLRRRCRPRVRAPLPPRRAGARGPAAAHRQHRLSDAALYPRRRRNRAALPCRGHGARRGACVMNFDSELAALADMALLRRRRIAGSPCGPEMVVDGQPVLAFASNDYLGLAADPRLIEAAADGARRWGVGAGASHFLGGHFAAHQELEERLAAFVGMGKALLFSTGYMANLGIVPALAGRGDAIFADKLNHASLIDAVRLSLADDHRYPHGDLGTLSAQLAASPARQKLILTDAVFSMDGDIAPLAELLVLAERFNAWLVVDDAHGFGVLGPQGRGTAAHCQLPASKRLLIMGTLGKAAGVAGAFVAGDRSVIDWLEQKARTAVFTTAAPPLLAVALLESLRLIEAADPGDLRRTHLRALIDRLRTAWRRYAPDTVGGCCHRTPPSSRWSSAATGRP